MYVNQAFVDVTDTVYVNDEIEINRGRPDEATETPAGTSKLTLKNDDLRWSIRNPLGPYYGDLRKQVPLENTLRVGRDTFGRTSSSTWTIADSGDAWLHFGSGSPSLTEWTIAGGVALTSVGAVSSFRASYMSDKQYLDVDVQAEFTVPFSNVTGGDIEPGNLLTRMQNITTYYMARVVITAAEAVTISIHHSTAGQLIAPVTVAGLTFSGQSLTVRMQSEGHSHRAKVWPTGGVEPLAWQVVVNDRRITTAGYVGIRHGVAAGNTNALPIVFGTDNFTVCLPRFAGEVAKFPNSDNKKGTSKRARIVASDTIRRLGQGKSPVMSSLKRGNLGIGAPLVAYWPCEDGRDSTAIASALGGPEMRTVFQPDYAVNDDFPCSRPIPNVMGTGWFGDPPEHEFTTSYQVRFLVSIPAAGAGVTDVVLLRVLMENSDCPVWELVYYTSGGGELAVIVFDEGNAQIHNTLPVGFSLNGNPTRLSLEIDQVGSDVDYNLSAVRLDLAGGGISGTVTGVTMGPMRQIMISPQTFSNFDCAVGHITLENQITNLFANSAELIAWRGERALTRLSRLCAENGVPFYFQASATDDTPEMGPQRPENLLDLLRECARTDGGSLFSPRGTIGVEYRTRASLYAQTARLTADLALKQLGHPFTPLEDDQQTRNDMEVENRDGSSARVELVEGRLSVNDYPDGIGRFDTSVQVNLANQSELVSHADFRLSIGTVDEPRYPDLHFELDAPEAASIVRAILELNIDDRLVINNAGPMTGVYDPISQLARGLREVWTNHVGKVYVNASPESPYAASAFDGAARLSSGSSSLSAALSASATGTFQVVTTDSKDLWITTATHQPDADGVNHFPVDIRIGGEKITISAITGATSPQTFTVATNGRGVNGVHEPGFVGKAHAAGAEVDVHDPFRFVL